MIHHRTAEEVRKFDIFKAVVFGILVALLLFGGLFGLGGTLTTETGAVAGEAAAAVTPAAGPESGAGAGATAETSTGATTPGLAAEATGESVAQATAETKAEATQETVAEATAEATTEATQEAIQVAAPAVDQPAGPLAPGQVTLSGAGQPGSEVEIVIDGRAAGKVTVGPDGRWTFPVELDRAGAYQVEARAVDAGGQVLAGSGPTSLTLAEPVSAATQEVPEEAAGVTPELAAEATVEVTTEATAEATQEATTEVAVEATAEATTEITVEATAGATVEATQEATAEVTAEAVQEATAEATAEATQEAIQVAAPAVDQPAGPLAPGQVTLSGAGQPGSEVEIVIDGRAAGKVTVGPDGRWTFPVELDRAGAYQIEARAVDAGGQVLAGSGPTSLTLAGPAEAAGPTATAGEPGGQAYIVQADDWLSKLALKFYGDMTAYPAIVEATNARAGEDASFAVIKNPDLIEIGQKLWIPDRAQ